MYQTLLKSPFDYTCSQCLRSTYTYTLINFQKNLPYPNLHHHIAAQLVNYLLRLNIKFGSTNAIVMSSSLPLKPWSNHYNLSVELYCWKSKTNYIGMIGRPVQTGFNVGEKQADQAVRLYHAHITGTNIPISGCSCDCPRPARSMSSP